MKTQLLLSSFFFFFFCLAFYCWLWIKRKENPQVQTQVPSKQLSPVLHPRRSLGDGDLRPRQHWPGQGGRHRHHEVRDRRKPAARVWLLQRCACFFSTCSSVMAQCGVGLNCLSLPSLLQDKAIGGQDGLLVLKSVKRTDSGMYKCMGVDYDNLDADLTGTVALTVNCERARRIRQKKIQAPARKKK